MKGSQQVFVRVLPSLNFTSLYKQSGLTDVLSSSRFNTKVQEKNHNLRFCDEVISFKTVSISELFTLSLLRLNERNQDIKMCIISVSLQMIQDIRSEVSSSTAEVCTVNACRLKWSNPFHWRDELLWEEDKWDEDLAQGKVCRKKLFTTCKCDDFQQLWCQFSNFSPWQQYPSKVFCRVPNLSFHAHLEIQDADLLKLCLLMFFKVILLMF